MKATDLQVGMILCTAISCNLVTDIRPKGGHIDVRIDRGSDGVILSLFNNETVYTHPTTNPHSHWRRAHRCPFDATQKAHRRVLHGG